MLKTRPIQNFAAVKLADDGLRMGIRISQYGNSYKFIEFSTKWWLLSLNTRENWVGLVRFSMKIWTKALQQGKL